MSLPTTFQRARPIDAMQRIVSSFKHFEKKLDKLQNDVNFHGQTLHELRVMVTSLAGNSIAPEKQSITEEIKPTKRLQKKSAAIQHDERLHENGKARRKNVSCVPSNVSKNNYKHGTRVSQTESPSMLGKYSSSPIGLSGKQALRPRKAEAPRKMNTMRVQQSLEKKRNKVVA